MAKIDKRSLIQSVSNDDTYDKIIEILTSSDHGILLDFFLNGNYEGQSLGLGDGIETSFVGDGVLDIFDDEFYSLIAINKCLSAAIRGTSYSEAISDDEVYSLYEEYWDWTYEYSVSFTGDAALGIRYTLADLISGTGRSILPVPEIRSAKV